MVAKSGLLTPALVAVRAKAALRHTPAWYRTGGLLSVRSDQSRTWRWTEVRPAVATLVRCPAVPAVPC